MAAEIRVDRITSRTGINTISLTGDGFSYLTNLGVGTTQPTSKLHVVGDTLITGVSTFTGDSTFSGNVTIGGTITYQDVKHIDAVGIITAQQGIQVLANGLNITGVSTFTDDVIVDGTVSAAWTFDKSANALRFKDNVIAKFGTGDDLLIYHDGSNSYIKDNGTGDLGILGDNNLFFQNAAGTENKAKFYSNGAVELYYDNSKKIETTSDGIDVTGTVGGDQLNISGIATVGTALSLADNVKAQFGTGGDLQVYHTGSAALIDNNTGNLTIDTANDFYLRVSNGSQQSIYAETNGTVRLSHSGNTKLATSSTGVDVTGGVVATGVVTATSFSGDGSALTGIAAGGSGEFNTGITSTVKFTPLGYESTMFTFPTTSGYQYVVDSINVANVSDTVGIGTSINIIVSIANTNGTSERTHIAYNIPIADGGLVELLKNPFVASPGDVMRAWTTRGSDYVGLSSCANIYMNYTGTADSTDYVTGFASTIGIQTGQVNTGFYTSFTYPSNLQSIRLTNRTDDGDYPVSVSIKTGATTSYLVKDLIIPRYASVDILARQKRIEINDIVQVSVGATSTIDIILAGKKITS